MIRHSPNSLGKGLRQIAGLDHCPGKDSPERPVAETARWALLRLYREIRKQAHRHGLHQGYLSGLSMSPDLGELRHEQLELGRGLVARLSQLNTGWYWAQLYSKAELEPGGNISMVNKEMESLPGVRQDISPGDYWLAALLRWLAAEGVEKSNDSLVELSLEKVLASTRHTGNIWAGGALFEALAHLGGMALAIDAGMNRSDEMSPGPEAIFMDATRQGPEKALKEAVSMLGDDAKYIGTPWPGCSTLDWNGLPGSARATLYKVFGMETEDVEKLIGASVGALPAFILLSRIRRITTPARCRVPVDWFREDRGSPHSDQRPDRDWLTGELLESRRQRDRWGPFETVEERGTFFHWRGNHVWLPPWLVNEDIIKVEVEGFQVEHKGHLIPVEPGMMISGSRYQGWDPMAEGEVKQFTAPGVILKFTGENQRGTATVDFPWKFTVVRNKEGVFIKHAVRTIWEGATRPSLDEEADIEEIFDAAS